jgi:PAS domain S-box-containing protein
MLGYDRHELIGLSARDIVVESEMEHIRPALDVINSQSDYCREWRFRRKDGSSFAAEVRATQMPDGNLLAMIHDITERQRAEARWRRLVDSNVEGVVFWNTKGEIIHANAAFLRIVGYTHEDLAAGRIGWMAITPPEYAEVDQHALEEIAAHGVCTPFEKEYIRKDGLRVPVMLGAASFEDTPDEGVCFVLDISTRRQYEESLREATHKAEQASLAKSEFLANMSHEMRTPMNAVIGLSYLLGQTALNEQQSMFLTKVQLASKSLLVVLNNVLDLSKIEAGELIVECATFSLRDLLQELADVMAVQADAKGIDFEIDVPDELPTAVEGDAARLHQVLINLLSNAVKFTERGGVRLSVRQLAATSTRVKFCFVVQDTGIGIAPEVQAGLFTPFSQADASITRRFGGTGLGLSIVKRLVHLMGGEVDLNSTPGVGSAFRVVLDLELASAEALIGVEVSPVAAGKHALLGVRVLVVDDSEINLDVTKRILELQGAQVWLSRNGQDAFEQLRAEPDAIDVVLMDVRMPLLDGHAAARRIRLEPSLVNLPIIALTADALSSQRERAAAAGMDDYIVKPFDAKALVRGILRRVTPANGQRLLAVDLTPEARTPPTVGWPEIEGIDSSDARARLSDDRDLFRATLSRLLDEFSDVAIEPMADPVALAVHSARMHKLRGSAGMLGAKAIQQLACESEAACAAGDAARAAQLATRLATILQRLQQSAAPALMAAQTQEAATLSNRAELEPQDLVDLVELLRQQSLSAIDYFSSISPQLRGLLSEESYELVRNHIDNLQFTDAANALEANRGIPRTAPSARDES